MSKIRGKIEQLVVVFSEGQENLFGFWFSNTNTERNIFFKSYYSIGSIGLRNKCGDNRSSITCCKLIPTNLPTFWKSFSILGF